MAESTAVDVDVILDDAKKLVKAASFPKLIVMITDAKGVGASLTPRRRMLMAP